MIGPSGHGLIVAILAVSACCITGTDGQCDSCTLTVMCWMNGGTRTREAGCPGPSWLTTCCSPGGGGGGGGVTRSEREDQRQLAPGLRSNPGGAPFALANTIGESIANFGRDDWLTASSVQPNYLAKVTSAKAVNNPFGASALAPYNQLVPPQPPLQPPQNQILTAQQQLYQHKHFNMPPISHHGLYPSANSLNGLSSAKSQPICGVQPLKTSKLQKRIIGGDQAQFGEFPWQVHIRIAGFQCGGVLLNHQYIATAAHCVHRAKLSQIIIFLGEYDTKDLDKSEILPKETLGVVERKIHPQFKYMLTQPDRYDVAVLKLSRPVAYRDNILPICLPAPGKDYEGALGVVAGWGKTDTSFGKTGTNLLQKVYVPILNNRMCYVWHELKDIILELHDEMFCAGHEQGKMDACLGDSGGPLVVNDGGRWVLVGITSAGFGCAVDHQPGIYHKVGKTVNWIVANIID